MVPILSAILRNNHVSSIEQIFIRHLVASIFSIIALGYLLFFKDYSKINSSLNGRVQFSYVTQAIIMNLMIVVYFISISLNTPAGEAALFVQIHPITTFIISYLWLKETINRNKIYSLLLAILGLLILLRPWEFEAFGKYLLGDLLAMSNGIFYSFYIVVGRKSRNIRKGVSSLISNSWVMIWAFILGLLFLYSLAILPLPSEINSFNIQIFNNNQNLFFGILLGLAGSIIPYGLLMIGLPLVESSKAAILLLGEPIGAILFGYLILNEPITIYYIIGGILLFISIIWIAKQQNIEIE